MYQYHCLNPIAEVGLKNFNGNYAKTDKIEDADAVLVRSAAMHDLELPDGLYAVARAGAVSTTFRWINVQKKVSLYLTHREPMQTA